MPSLAEDQPRKGHNVDENPNVIESKKNIKLKIEGGPALTYAYLSMRGYYPNDPNKPNQACALLRLFCALLARGQLRVRFIS